jgi:transposase
LTAEGCTHVAIESTGVYWKPVFNILEGPLSVILVNARDVKAVPGRKTDVRDCEWLADLLRHGLLKASFIPPLEIGELRELTRYRQTLVKEHTALANRIQKLIESANIKLGQVATDVLGASGRQMLRALADGEEDVEVLVEMARSSLRTKKPELRRALTSRLTPAQRFVLSELLGRVMENEAATARVNEQIAREVAEGTDPFVSEAVQLLQTIPGVGLRVAEVIVSEIGVDMTRFPSDAHLASWAGLCPGNNESAGKRRSTQTTKGSPYLRAALTQAAWAVAHEGYVSGGAVPSAGPAHGAEEGIGGGGAQPARDRLPCTGAACRLSRTGRRLLRPAAAPDATAAAHQEAREDGAEGDGGAAAKCSIINHLQPHFHSSSYLLVRREAFVASGRPRTRCEGASAALRLWVHDEREGGGREFSLTVIEVKSINIANIESIQRHVWKYRDLYAAQGNPFDQARRRLQGCSDTATVRTGYSATSPAVS